GGGDHAFHYTFRFPAGFDEFMLDSYELRANSGGCCDTSELPGPTQKKWSDTGFQDVSFGTAAQKGPITSFGRLTSVNCENCTKSFPKNGQPFQVGNTVKTFRMGWGENGGEDEGWYPWWSGTIRLR
ncbi:MAG: hypothetical protein ABEL76_08440, partial [Bradymonadaceae bacterium]